MKPKLRDAVKLLQALPDDDLPAGAIGVVVAEFTQPEEAYEVEFCDETGATVA
jgi:Domain of unknown function (DUF4926)